jgi:hypothetical protein
MRVHEPTAESPEPIRGSDHNAHVGDQGELWFAAQLPLGWVWQPPRRDFGKDGLIVIRDNSELHNLEFAVQVKTSERPVISDGWVVKSGLSRSSVMYWFASPLPTLVVAVDIVGRRAWFAWHLDLFESPTEVFHSTQNTVTIRLLERNALNDAGWDTIRQRLREHFSSLVDALAAAQAASRLLPAVNSLARNVGNLVKLSKVPMHATVATMTDQSRMSIFIEQLEHKSALSAVRALLAHIRPDTRAWHHIRAWTDAYEATALRAYPSLAALPEHGPFAPDLEFAFTPELVLGTRQRLIEAGLDMIMLLTARQKESDTDEAGDGARRTREIEDVAVGSVRTSSPSSNAWPVSIQLRLVRLSVADLGHPQGATTGEIIGTENDADRDGHSAPFTAGSGCRLGLGLCPPDAGPSLRLEYADQPLGERLHIAMKPIASSDGEPRIFVVERDAKGMALDAVRARPDDRWKPTDMFIFKTL